MKRTPIGCRPRRPEAAECLKKNLVCRTRFRGIGKRGSDKDGSLGSLALPRQARKRPPGAALDESWRESLGEACKRSAVAHCLAAMARPIKRARRLFPGDPSPRHGRDKGSAWRIEWNAGELLSERLDHGIDHRRVERVRRLEPPRADPACRYLAFERVDEPGRAGDHASVRGINGRNRKSSWQARARLPAGLSIAAVNAANACVVSGPSGLIDSFEREISARGISARRLKTSHAFHSAMVDPVIEPLAEKLSSVPLNPPGTPFVSTVSGTWITREEATSPLYWARHCRETVRYGAALACLTEAFSPAFIECGPGRTLTSLARQSEASQTAVLIGASLPDATEGRAADEIFLETLGRLWAAGAAPDWRALHEGESRRRLPLPTYPFQRKRYFVDAPSAAVVRRIEAEPAAAAIRSEINEITSMANAFEPRAAATLAGGPGREAAVRAELASLLEDLSGIDVASAPAGTSFLELGFDSLFLTQASQAIKTRFKAAVSFRQMMGELSTLDALTDHLSASADFEIVPAVERQAATVAASTASPPAAGPAPLLPAAAQCIEQVMAAQLASMSELINRQLETLRQMGGAPPGITAAPPAFASRPSPAL